jgi:hypothetical protein
VDDIFVPTIDTATTSAMILLCEHPAVAGGAKVENRSLVFQTRSASFAPLRWMRERPINIAV